MKLLEICHFTDVIFILNLCILMFIRFKDVRITLNCNVFNKSKKNWKGCVFLLEIH
jgi:hypothetical protein